MQITSRENRNGTKVEALQATWFWFEMHGFQNKCKSCLSLPSGTVEIPSTWNSVSMKARTCRKDFVVDVYIYDLHVAVE